MRDINDFVQQLSRFISGCLPGTVDCYPVEGSKILYFEPYKELVRTGSPIFVYFSVAIRTCLMEEWIADGYVVQG